MSEFLLYSSLGLAALSLVLALLALRRMSTGHEPQWITLSLDEVIGGNVVTATIKTGAIDPTPGSSYLRLVCRNSLGSLAFEAVEPGSLDQEVVGPVQSFKEYPLKIVTKKPASDCDVTITAYLTNHSNERKTTVLKVKA